MYRFILAIVLIIILSLSLKYILLEPFSVSVDARVERLIQENNNKTREERKLFNENQRAISRFNNIKEMEHIVKNLRDKVVSAKEIINSDYPTCRKIDLYPNIDFSTLLPTDAIRSDRFRDDFEEEYRTRNDLARSEEWNGHVYGRCSDYPDLQNFTTNEKKSKCRMDPYCRVVADTTNTNGFTCEYKQLNHDCYNRTLNADGGSTPVSLYINPGTLDNI